MMGPGEALVGVAFFGLLIALTILAGSMFKRYMGYKERQLGLTADATAEKAAQYASHVKQLEQRVRVLERIATDKGADLAQQIEDLRDEKGLITVERIVTDSGYRLGHEIERLRDDKGNVQ